MGFFKKVKTKVQKTIDKVSDGFDNLVDNAKDKFKQLDGDKHERAEDCFKKLTDANIKLCFASSKQPITSYAQIQDVTIGRIDAVGERIQDYCISEFNSNGIVLCSTLTTPDNTDL